MHTTAESILHASWWKWIYKPSGISHLQTMIRNWKRWRDELYHMYSCSNFKSHSFCVRQSVSALGSLAVSKHVSIVPLKPRLSGYASSCETNGQIITWEWLRWLIIIAAHTPYVCFFITLSLTVAVCLFPGLYQFESKAHYWSSLPRQEYLWRVCARSAKGLLMLNE